MIWVETQYGGKIMTVQIYDEWDVDQSQVVTAWDATKKDKGKFLKFTDGSNWYTKIVNVSDTAIKTEAGTIRKEDLAICSKIKYPAGYYSGVPSTEESPLVRPYTRREKEYSTKFINGTLPEGKRLTPRMRLLVVEKLKAQAEAMGVDPEFIVRRLHHWASGDGIHAFKSTMVLGRIIGAELEQQLQAGGGIKVGKLTQNFVNIKDERRSAGALPEDMAVPADFKVEAADRERVGIPTTESLRQAVHGDSNTGTDQRDAG